MHRFTIANNCMCGKVSQCFSVPPRGKFDSKNALMCTCLPDRPVAGDGGWGGASGCSAPTWNLENIKDKRVDQPAKKRASPYRIHMLLLLNHRTWKLLVFENVCTCKMLRLVL
jgi:hypothetical protein